MAVTCSIHDGPLPPALCAPIGMISAARGAISSFIGVVRDHAQGRAVSGLFYECYRDMALAVLQRLGQEAVEAHAADLEVVIVHGTGSMVPGDISVCILTASAHRASACAASRQIIERLKRDVPIWKRQTFADGESEWVGSP